MSYWPKHCLLLAVSSCCQSCHPNSADATAVADPHPSPPPLSSSSSECCPKPPCCLVVLCAATVLHGCSTSLAYSFATLFVDWSETFDSSKSATAWVISLNIGFMFFIGRFFNWFRLCSCMMGPLHRKIRRESDLATRDKGKLWSPYIRHFPFESHTEA